jgi:CubicO group peptidase (beta-lactamase class C family)
MGQFLMRHKLQRKPGEKSDYSNLGMGLLGHILQLKSGYDYESLMEKVITGPLNMTHTRITLDEDDLARLAQGHTSDGEPAKNWDIPTLAGAGAIRATSGDMLKYVAANAGLTHTQLDQAIELAQRIHFQNPDDSPGDVGLGWQLQRAGNVVWHNGGTGGYSSFIGMQPRQKIGVVVLGNTSSDYVTQLGFRLLKFLGGSEVQPFSLPTKITLSEKQLTPLVGKYRVSPLVVAEVTRDDDQLFIQLTGQPRIKIFPAGETSFFCQVVDAKFDFEADDSGTFTKMVIHQNGLDIPCARLEDDGQDDEQNADKKPKEKAPAG